MESCWMHWCRLCANDASEGPCEPLDAMMVTAIGKYFWVNIMPEDKLPNKLCSECYDMVSGLMEFSQHVNKVQSMYYDLITADIKYVEKSQEIRINHGIDEQEWRYVLRKQNKINNIFAVNETETEAELEAEHEEFEPFSSQRNSEEDTLELHVELQNSFTESEDPDKDLKPLSSKYEISCEQDILNLKEIECTKNNSYMVNIPRHSCEVEEFDDEEFIDNNEGSDDYENLRKVRRSKRNTINNDQLDVPNSCGGIGNRPKREKNKTEAALSSPYESRFMCKICKRKYKNPTSYRRHMLESHKTAPDIPDFKCAECNKIYPTEKQLNIHERTHLPLELKMDIPCPYCDKKMTKVTVLRQHIKGQHYNNKPYICDECGKPLKTMAALNEHKLVHTNECPFECEICHKRFKNKARLKTHSDVHAESTYSCHVCGMRLNTRRTLKMHMLVHSEDKQYKCTLCPQAFKRGKALKNHLILHTGMRPYKCTFCEKTFSNGSNCRAHKKKMHPIELANEEAEGIKTTSKTIVPRLEELRSSTNVVAPRPHIRGSSSQLLQLIMKEGDKTNIQTQGASKINYKEDDDEYMTTVNDDISDNDLSLTAQGDNDDNENIGVDEHNGETTMVYQIVEDI